MNSRHTVLVVDDEAYVRESLLEVVEGHGLNAVAAADTPSALALLETEAVDAIVADLQMPGGGATALLEAVRAQGIGIPILVITGVGTIASAVEAMKAGAFDFLQKPVDPEQLVLVLRRALEHSRLLSDVRFLRRAASEQRAPARLVGESAALRQVRELLAQVARTDATVLVTGESGTGKELVAEQIHEASPRAERNLVRVNCSAIPESLFESEFFGHRRGAFSGAISNRAGRFAESEGGTLVLDEIGTLRPEMQAKLLRVLEGGEYQVVGESRTRVADVRVIAITNEPLAEAVRTGTFRADLYYRLSIFPIEVPPLRRHKEDIPELAAHLLGRMLARPETGGDAGAPSVPRLPADVLEILTSYDWPGNVRELRNVLERALIICGERTPDARVFRSLLESSLPQSDGPVRGDLHLRSGLDAEERDLIQAALIRAEGKKKDAAALLGIDARNLGYYLRKHGLSERPSDAAAPPGPAAPEPGGRRTDA
jgi:DNA-binding NtrC family response regulator